jgi:hypothetical protein
MPIGVSSAPYAKFPQPGVRHGGEIVDFRVVQTTDQKTRRPQYLEQNQDGKWVKSYSAFGPDGRPNDPITQWEITVETGIEDENGDSELRIFVDPRKGRRGSTVEGRRGGDAVAIALKKAKAHRVGLEIGAKFFLISGEKVLDGEMKTNTWTAEYEPPAGGVGSGGPVDEMPWLIGGGRYDRQAELAKWEAARNAGTAAAQAFVPPAAPAAPAAEIPGLGNHASSTVLNGRPAPVSDQDSPPF